MSAGGARVESEMKKRAAVRLLAVALLACLGWIGQSHAQTKIARVGVLATPVAGTPNEAMDKYYEVFRQALAERGWIQGQNIAFEYRSARGSPPQFGEPAAELVWLKVDVIYANNAPATRAAHAATRSIPIVGLDYTNDPVAAGYAESYSRPGRNLTGFFLDAPEFASKWLDLLKSVVPGLSQVAVLWDPTPGTTHLSAIQGAAQSFAVQLQIVEVRKPQDIDAAFSAFRARTQALVILPSAMTWAESPRLAELAVKYRLPAISMADLFTQAGGMVSYGPDSAAALRSTAILVAKVLDGVKPGDIPVERPTKFKLVVNQKTAKALGLILPQPILVSADNVIQ